MMYFLKNPPTNLFSPARVVLVNIGDEVDASLLDRSFEMQKLRKCSLDNRHNQDYMII